MLTPNLFILYVENPLLSAEFYERIFELKPVDAFPTWVAFTFENGLSFALWSLAAKDFKSGGEGHRSEMSFLVENETEVRRLHKVWEEKGVTIEQDIHKAVFGETFVALDPDGHRIRVCIPDN